MSLESLPSTCYSPGTELGTEETVLIMMGSWPPEACSQKFMIKHPPTGFTAVGYNYNQNLTGQINLLPLSYLTLLGGLSALRDYPLS